MSVPSEILKNIDIESLLEEALEELKVTDIKEFLKILRSDINRIRSLSSQVIRLAVYYLLSRHPEFDHPLFISQASDFIEDFVSIDVRLRSGRPFVKVILDESYYSEIKSLFPSWKNAIKKFRNSIGAQIEERYALRNSHYMKILYSKHGADIFAERVPFQQSPASFLLVIEKGNQSLNWSGVEYGGFPTVVYQGIPLGEKVVRVLEESIRRFLEKYRSFLVVDMTKLLEQVYKEADSYIAGIIDEAVSFYLQKGKIVPGQFVIKIKGKFYEIIRTRAGRLGLRYSLKLNVKRD